VPPYLCWTHPTNRAPDLNDVGDFEYWKIRPVLLRLESPAQLHEIETNSPQIRGEDAEIWRGFIARDIPNWEQKNYLPKNPLKWYQVYLKYKKEQQLEIARDEEILRASMGQLKKAKETNVSKVMDLRALPKVPRDPWMMANNGGVPIGKRTGLFKKEGPSSLVWSSGSRTKLTNGQSVLTRARREAKEISQRSKLAKPTHELKAQAGQVRKAPAGMVNEYKKASEPPIRILTRKKPLAKSPSAVRGPSLEERESRLSAIQAGISQKKSTAAAGETLIGSSDEDELDTDIMFNKTSIQHSRPTPFSSSSHPSASSPNTSAIQSKPLGSPGSS
jgi:elongin-A